VSSTASAAEKAPTRRRVTFHRNEVYEVQALWSRTGERASLNAWLPGSPYSPQQPYGATLLALEPEKALYGNYLPTIVRWVAWPDLETFDRVQCTAKAAQTSFPDPRLAESTITLARLHPEIHAFPDEVEIELDATLCYETSAFWDHRDAPRAAWDAFIEAVTPSIGAHGGHPLLVFQPLRCVRGDFFPDRFCVAAWDSLGHFESFIAAPEHTEISRLRWRAVSRMGATATRLVASL
jgi:uncharacterized protein (DUF1330 family)